MLFAMNEETKRKLHEEGGVRIGSVVSCCRCGYRILFERMKLVEDAHKWKMFTCIDCLTKKERTIAKRMYPLGVGDRLED